MGAVRFIEWAAVLALGYAVGSSGWVVLLLVVVGLAALGVAALLVLTRQR